MIVKLVMGDPSNDGHGISETILLSTEYTVEQISGFVSSAENVLGVRLDEIANEYEEPFIAPEYRDALLFAGVVGPEDFETWNDKFWVSPDDYIHIFLSFAKLGNGGKSVGEVLEVPEIGIGGYGLYQH